jgi:hypothetical protein
VRAGRVSPAGMASQDPAVFLAAGVDRDEGGCGESDEDARVVGDGVGDALAAGQPGPDELVGIGAVDLGAGWAARGAASFAGDGQDPARFVDAGVAVQQFPGGPVDVIDAASHQDGLYAPACAPGRARRKGIGGQRWCSSRRALAGGWTSGGRPLARRVNIRLVVSGPLSGRTFRAELLDVAVGQEFIVAVQHATASYQGRRLDVTGCQLMRLEQGRIAEVRGHYSDQEALDAFWVTG